ncbi:tyrosinase-like protein 2 [Saccostrea echinata]|uniref:tyrosinase-like protein 2 n=1 Tax=Saccostrea echinata TaxID=191078 RepID=UPI002A833994|nr:tyrosinase-like protein 2 [Saccostrea echinata]
MEGQQSLNILLVLALGLPSALGLVQEIPIPTDLEECLLYKSLNVSVADVPGKLIEDFCLQNFALYHYDENTQRNISAEGINYLESLFRQINAETRMTRSKRQARATWRVRSEIRTLSSAQRNRIFSCLNRLKRDYTIDRSVNTYDLIGSLHSAQATRFMHNGPSFLGRHAVYLLVMETACRTPIPYWDFTMDGEMNDPSSSAIWSNTFFGNGNGAVRTGFCGNWVTPQNTPIIRNLGAGGVRIPGKQALRALLSRTRTSEITEPQPAMSVFSIEVHHNAVHNNIGGLFAGLDTAPFDPVFWFLHSMFNYIWYLFKINQRARGIDPQRDYPQGPNVPQGHEFFQRLNFRPFFRPMTNLETFSDRFDRIVRYTPLPTCSQCAGNPYLVCLRGMCVARSRGRGTAVGVAPGVIRPGVVARRVLIPRAPVLIRGKRSIYTNNTVVQIIQSHEEAISTLDKSYLNTFIINGHYTPKDWVYLNVRVVYERPRNVHFNSTDLGDSNDMHDPINFQNAGENIGIKDRVFYKQKCEPAGSGATKVFVESNGLNYHGKYKEFSILDERQAVSSAVIQVAVRKPSDKHTESFLSAYDSCGRVCRPACPVAHRSSTVYKACTGTFKITTEYPLMYSNSYETAISSLWHLSLDGKGPLFRNTFSPVTFICDHQNAWPWSRK